jgi:signal transduction histidine kinase
VNDLLMIAQLDARVGGAATRVDLGELVGEELAIRRRSASDAATTIEYSHVPGLVVQADPVRLRRLITNLLDNAERHAASMVSVRVWYEPAINARSSGFAMLEVLDDGPGIAPDQRELVFQRFIRLDAARAKDSAGTGLGLAIARQIAEEAGGSLRILGSPRGARFVLALPAVHGAAGPPVEPGAPGLAAPGTPA